MAQIIVAGPHLAFHRFAAGLDPLTALVGKLLVADFFRHPLGHPQLRQVHAADVRGQAVELLAFDPLIGEPAAARSTLPAGMLITPSGPGFRFIV